MVDRTITVKQEKSAFIKAESEMACDYPCGLEYIHRKNSTEQVADLMKEKATLIEQLIDLKRDNMRLDLQVKRYEDDVQKTAAMHTSTIDLLNKKMSTLQNTLAGMKQSQKQNIGQIHMLTKQNKLYVAQIDQLRKSMNITQDAQTEEFAESDDDDDEYDVEKITKHKTVKGKRMFLVRWKGFSSKCDQWIPEQDLFCPDILADYKTTKKLQ